MILDALQWLLMAIGAVTAVGFVAVLWGLMYLITWDEATPIVKHYIQSYKDTKLFRQVEEFHRDFS